MDPDSPNLEWQVAFEKGVSLRMDLATLSAELKDTFARKVAAANRRPEAALMSAKRLLNWELLGLQDVEHQAKGS